MTFSEQYLTYTEYQDLCGTLGQVPFNMLEFEARKNIDRYTFSRLVNLETQRLEVKQCVFDLINILNSYKSYENQSKSISSENTDGYNINYSQASENVSKSKINDISTTIYEYLAECKLADGTPYLYRG